MNMIELIKNVLQMILYTVITGYGVAIVSKVLEFINSKIDEVQTATKLTEYDKLNKIIDQAQSIIYNVVITINQTFVNTLKMEGKFDKESAEIAKNTAIDKATELINKETTKVIEEVYGNFDSYLDITIESTVNQLKQNKK